MEKKCEKKFREIKLQVALSRRLCAKIFNRISPGFIILYPSPDIHGEKSYVLC